MHVLSELLSCSLDLLFFHVFVAVTIRCLLKVPISIEYTHGTTESICFI